MRNIALALATFGGVIAAAALGLIAGCGPNATAVRAGIVTVQVSNETQSRLFATLVVYDPFDLEDEDNRDTVFVEIPPNANAFQRQFTCRRQIAIGGAAVESFAEPEEIARPELASEIVAFSDQPVNTPSQYVIDAGTSEPVQVQLGIDYLCGEGVTVRFFEDAAAPGGFNYEVIISARQ